MASSERESLRSYGSGSVIPLVVDLDGTLVSGDLLAETLVAHLAARPHDAFLLARLLAQGKANLKAHLSELHPLAADELPYRQSVLDVIAAARSEGRPVYLATASHERYASAIAAHLGVFDGVLATAANDNLAGDRKATALVERFGEAGFDYIGNSSADLAVWSHARRCYAVATSASVSRRLRRSHDAVEALESPRLTIRVWLRALRVHQYAKNALIFLPMLAAHALKLDLFVNCLLAFVAFSMAASAIYLVNDLVDITHDRAHPSKRNRPIAAGLVSVGQAMVAVPLLLAASALVTLFLPIMFAAVLLGYLVLTTAYSFWLKRKMLIDVVVLALLYSARVYAGGAATDIVLSDWLLAFCLFAFTSLALIKRYTELLVRVDRQLPDAQNRNYRKDDLPVIVALAAGSGLNTVTVLALYVQSPDVALHYRHPHLLWALCPLLLFLMSRALMMAHRRLMHDDPIVWAMRDRVFRQGIVAAGVIVAVAAFL
ncbi:UbiA family prenyltransferase [Sphingomonas azotifigens]|uniref:UbiA family prenyltransferase n=1 Tax=Sphingomonas azotifigens TaxID=330920 RepID=UPI000A00E174|nr:UbiA family prenyltransferase [Sphingomonas azotifigens]